MEYDFRQRKVTISIVTDMAWMDGLSVEDSMDLTRRVVPKQFLIEFSLDDMKVYRTDIFTSYEPQKRELDLGTREYPEAEEESNSDLVEE